MLLRLRNSAAAMTGMVREQERTANNLANAGTVGFKRDRTFIEVLSERLDDEGAPRSDRVQRQWTDFSAGAMEQTGNPFDLGLDGEGFFALLNEDTGETHYTRAGRFTPDAEGALRAPGGLALEGEQGTIVIPTDARTIEIDQGGAVRADGRLLDRLRVVRFDDPNQLRRINGAVFTAVDAEPLEADTIVRQGFVEQSNANPLQEMTGMIEHLRLFEMQQRMLRGTDENLASSVRSLGRF